VEIKGGMLLSSLPFDEVMRPLQRIVRHLATGAVTVTHLKRQPQMVAYIDGLGADLPDPSKASGSPVPVEDLPPPASSGGGKGSEGAGGSSAAAALRAGAAAPTPRAGGSASAA